MSNIKGNQHMEKVAVILCGGLGTRLRPYTITIPKPLMPIGDYSILEIIVKQLKEAQFDRLILAVNYRSDLIKAFFQDGARFGIKIEYSEESEPLGTIAPLKNISSLPEKFMVMNGDILTNLNYGDYFSAYNPKSEFALVPTYKKVYKSEFGVLTLNNHGNLADFSEKPSQELFISMGVYYFSQKLFEYVPDNTPFGFDQLMLKALEGNERIKCPEHIGDWLDIGNHQDYEYAQDNWNNISRRLFLG